jgi:hypothetical protein
MNKIEIRSLPTATAELRIVKREDTSERGVEGYGIVFNSESEDLGGFTEVILPEAMNGVIERSDVKCVINHNIDRGLLARCTEGEGTMTLEVDAQGVKYSFDAPNYDLGDELIEGLLRGDIRASSFGFTVAPSGDHWEKRDGGMYLRTIKQFDRLYDMSPVYSPAYRDATVAKRCVDELRSLEELPEEETKPPVGVEPIAEPIVKTEDRLEEEMLELQYRAIKQRILINELTR